jgi:hypothetical protein
MLSVLVVGIGNVMAATSNVSNVGFQYSTNGGSTWTLMSGDLVNGFVLPTDNNSATTYLVSYTNTTTATNLGNGPFGLYLENTTVPISTLQAFYSGKPEPYKTYLDNALLTGNVTNQTPFAYIFGPSANLRLQDATQWDVNDAHTLVQMVIPGNYPEGTYVVEGIVNDGTVENPTNTTVTYTLIIGDQEQVVNGSLVGNATVTVVPGEVNVSISPLLITFGNLRPGTINSTATSGNVTISASTTNASNSNISIGVSVTESILFENNLFFNGNLADGYVVNLPCIGAGICTYAPVTLIPTLTVPFGTSIGFDSAVIIYTITGATP